MNESENNPLQPDPKYRFGCLQVLGIIGVVIVITALVAVLWVKRNIYASEFRPTKLDVKEQEILDSKLARLEESAFREQSVPRSRGKAGKNAPSERLEPEPYNEKGAKREINLSERELNAMIANKTDLAQRVAIDLSDDLLSVKLIVPVDEEVMMLGGKTLRLHMGVKLSFQNNKPVVALKGVSIGGIPLPNAWLGYLKGKNLIDEFGSEEGFWKLFADGVEDLQVREGHIRVQLKE